MNAGAGISLFSYGTLQQPEVQLANYGRLLVGEPDVLVGYALESIAIDDPDVVTVSGKATHTIAIETGSATDRVLGMVFVLSEAELEATDAYETSAYTRVEARLQSGRVAWVYVKMSYRDD